MKEKKLIKTKINPKILKFAKKFNISFRVGHTVKSCDIVTKELPKDIPAAYFGHGVIFVRDLTECCKEDMDIICLHEMGHAILDLFPLKRKHFKPFEEISANMVSLSLAAQLRLPLTHRLLTEYNAYNKLVLGEIKGRKNV